MAEPPPKASNNQRSKPGESTVDWGDLLFDNGAPSKEERERDERYYKTRDGFVAAAAENTDAKQAALRQIAQSIAVERPQAAQPNKDRERGD